MSDMEKAQLTDIPITCCEHDKLNRVKYAEAIANFIYNAPAIKEHSQIVAIYGPWGSGKSSLKNMICEKYVELPSKKTDETLIIVNFSPWVYSNNDKLPYLFFRTIASGFQKNKGGSVENVTQSAEDVVSKWEVFAQSLSAFEIPVISIATSLGIPVWVLSLIKTISAFLKKIGTLCKITEPRAVKDLEAQKEELKKILANKEQRVLVVIEDLDRVSPTEIRNLITLVKANGDFPYITYLLVGDRDYIAKALTEKKEGEIVCDGYDYLKKIVALEFDLPPLPYVKKRQELSDGLLAVTTEIGIKGFNPKVHLRSYTMALLSNLRDIKRFINAVHFRLELQKVQEEKTCGSLSIDFSDLLTLETCRIFENRLYRTLYQEQNLLLQNNRTELSTKQMESIFLGQLSNPDNPTLNDFAQSLLSDLFGWEYVSSYPDDKERNGFRKDTTKPSHFRIRNPKRFANYFLRDPDLSQYSGHDEDCFGETLGKEPELLKLFSRLSGEGKMDVFLDERRSRYTELNSEEQTSLWKALFRFVETEDVAGLQKPYDISDNPIVASVFSTIMSVTKQGNVFYPLDSLMDVMDSDDSLVVLPAQLLNSEMAPNKSSHRFENSNLKKLDGMVYRRLLKLQQDGCLINHCNEFDLRRILSNLFRNDMDRKIQIKIALYADFQKHSNIFHALLTFSVCESEYSPNPSWIKHFLDYDRLCEIIDPLPVYGRIKDLDLKDEYEIQIRKCLEFCINAKADGKPYDKIAQKEALYGNNQ